MQPGCVSKASQHLRVCNRNRYRYRQFDLRAGRTSDRLTVSIIVLNTIRFIIICMHEDRLDARFSIG